MNKKQHTNDEEDLNNPFSFLSGDSRKGGKSGEPFRVPSAYFEHLGDEVENAVRLERLQIEKSAPFTVPAAYFDWLPSTIQDRLKAVQAKQDPLAWLRQLLMPRYWVPAGLAMAVLVYISIRVLTPSSNGTVATAAETALNETDVKEVLEDMELYGFDEGVVMDQASLADKSDKTTESSDNSADKKATIEYLLENNADINSISTE
jgi:hypothetical protein